MEKKEKKQKQYRAGDELEKTMSRYFEQKLGGIEVPSVPKHLPHIELTTCNQQRNLPVILRVAAAAVFVVFTLPLYLPENRPNELAQAFTAAYQKRDGPVVLKSSFGTFQSWVQDYYEK